MTDGRSSTRETLIDIGLLFAVAALYLVRLDDAPLYLLNDEIHGALQALALASTGRSVAGDLLPVYFREPGFLGGRDPVFIYVTALFLKVLPLSETTLRLPTALVGVLNVVLAYVLGRRVTGSRRAGLLTGAMLALTPAHFIHSRIAIPTLWPMPFLLGWLLGLERYSRNQRLKPLVAGMLCLGLAAYAYVGTALLVPLFAFGTFAWVFWDLEIRSLRPYVAGAVGLALPFGLMVYWQMIHPDRWAQLFGYYSATGASPGAATLLNFEAIQQRVTTYWNYFDPTFLFLAGDDGLRYSTGRSGVFLLVSAILLPLGIATAGRTSGIKRLVVYGLFAAPIIGSLQGAVHIQRVLPLVLFGALLSAQGAAWLFWRADWRHRLGVAILFLAALQFVVFAYDYFGAYRVRSGAHRGGNLRGAIVEAVDVARRQGATTIYMSENLPNVDLYWKFYARTLGATDLLDRSFLHRPGRDAISPPALLIAACDERMPFDPNAPLVFRLRSRVAELDDATLYCLYESVPR